MTDLKNPNNPLNRSIVYWLGQCFPQIENVHQYMCSCEVTLKFDFPQEKFLQIRPTTESVQHFGAILKVEPNQSKFAKLNKPLASVSNVCTHIKKTKRKKSVSAKTHIGNEQHVSKVPNGMISRSNSENLNNTATKVRKWFNVLENRISFSRLSKAAATMSDDSNEIKSSNGLTNSDTASNTGPRLGQPFAFADNALLNRRATEVNTEGDEKEAIPSTPQLQSHSQLQSQSQKRNEKDKLKIKCTQMGCPNVMRVITSMDREDNQSPLFCNGNATQHGHAISNTNEGLYICDDSSHSPLVVRLCLDCALREHDTQTNEQKTMASGDLLTAGSMTQTHTSSTQHKEMDQMQKDEQMAKLLYEEEMKETLLRDAYLAVAMEQRIREKEKKKAKHREKERRRRTSMSSTTLNGDLVRGQENAFSHFIEDDSEPSGQELTRTDSGHKDTNTESDTTLQPRDRQRGSSLSQYIFRGAPINFMYARQHRTSAFSVDEASHLTHRHRANDWKHLPTKRLTLSDIEKLPQDKLRLMLIQINIVTANKHLNS
ncbi:hypothetical protein RFI_05232 [Reticulomyxa filosa]|uniref:Uncharacterized protein n=1 Tax=Reticulomyxa filosa TaxID=46433 RepID=X6P106_RETFI|nr:hypothetical protein RFI_05232 [Reticulomyxa filosa]|eukprot:ETO31881.1 hypothetical protein RFI_05232 [Reticulomyxa filosa]